MSPTLRDADDSGTHGLKDYTDVCKTTTESERDYNGGGSENVPGPHETSDSDLIQNKYKAT